jgi:hypothetical protein
LSQKHLPKTLFLVRANDKADTSPSCKQKALAKVDNSESTTGADITSKGF